MMTINHPPHLTSHQEIRIPRNSNTSSPGNKRIRNVSKVWDIHLKDLNMMGMGNSTTRNSWWIPPRMSCGTSRTSWPRSRSTGQTDKPTIILQYSLYYSPKKKKCYAIYVILIPVFFITSSTNWLSHWLVLNQLPALPPFPFLLHLVSQAVRWCHNGFCYDFLFFIHCKNLRGLRTRRWDTAH